MAGAGRCFPEKQRRNLDNAMIHNSDLVLDQDSVTKAEGCKEIAPPTAGRVRGCLSPRRPLPLLFAAAFLLVFAAAGRGADEPVVDANTPISKLQVLLRDKEQSVRLAAINELRARGAAAASSVPKFKQMLPDADFDEFRAILDAVQEIKPPESAACYAILFKQRLRFKQCQDVVSRVVKNLPPKQALTVLDNAMKDYKAGKGVDLAGGGCIADAMRGLGEDGVKMADDYWKKDRIGRPGKGQN